MTLRIALTAGITFLTFAITGGVSGAWWLAAVAGLGAGILSWFFIAPFVVRNTE